MKRTCENCSRPLFDTDTICWHCGQKQSQPFQPESSSDQPIIDSTAEDDLEPEPEPASSALVLFYGGLTVIIIFALFLTVRSLGQSPIVNLQQGSPPTEWVSLNAPDSSFLIDIPARWSWQFQEGRRAESSFTNRLENDNRIAAAVTPLGDLIPDTEFLLIAQNDLDLLVVAQSERLNRLSPQQAVRSLQQQQFDNVTVKETQLIKGESGEERALLSLRHLKTSLHCDQYLVPASTVTYLVAACTSAENYDQQQATLTAALESFRTQSR